jgi:hypothetical protein
MFSIDSQGGLLVHGGRCLVAVCLDRVNEQWSGITRDDEHLFVTDTFGARTLAVELLTLSGLAPVSVIRDHDRDQKQDALESDEQYGTRSRGGLVILAGGEHADQAQQ